MLRVRTTFRLPSSFNPFCKSGNLIVAYNVYNCNKLKLFCLSLAFFFPRYKLELSLQPLRRCRTFKSVRATQSNNSTRKRWMVGITTKKKTKTKAKEINRQCERFIAHWSTLLEQYIVAAVFFFFRMIFNQTVVEDFFFLVRSFQLPIWKKVNTTTSTAHIVRAQWKEWNNQFFTTEEKNLAFAFFNFSLLF